MKKLLGLILVLSVGFACVKLMNPNDVWTVYAQTLPVNRTVLWDANPVADGVLNYTVKIDGVVVGSPTATSQPVTFATAGPHTVAVSATNQWGTSADATININIIVPGKVTNTRLQ